MFLVAMRSLAGSFIGLALLFQAGNAFSATWYVATNGFDANTGAINSPFATIKKAQTSASSNDTVYLRGGTYFLDNSHLTTTNNPWAIVNNMTKSGISYIAYPGERPVFNFTNVVPTGYRVTAFYVTASDCVFKGFDVTGVTINLTNGNVQSECFRVSGGNRNRFELLSMHDGMGIGWYLTAGASNLVLNCDAYNNRGLDSASIGNIDGFGAHPGSTSGKSNVFRGCRAWFNSDDGFDLINADAAVTIENCWSFYNGYFTNFASSGGDGHGFKSGGYGVSGGSYPTPVPRHVTRFCLAVKNRVSGFYANHHTDGLDFISNTSYRNGVNYNMLCNSNNVSGTNDCPGFNHVLKNNLGLVGSVTSLNTNACDASFNYFTMTNVTIATNDFMTLDESLLTLPRQTNGDLPYIAFAQLVGGSDAVNAGTNWGFAVAGTAPDLGAFEYGSHTAPTMEMAQVGTNLVFASTGGPLGGTNYIVMATNLSMPMTQWTRIVTNKFDLAGTSTLTNPTPKTVGPQFYRISLP